VLIHFTGVKVVPNIDYMSPIIYHYNGCNVHGHHSSK